MATPENVILTCPWSHARRLSHRSRDVPQHRAFVRSAGVPPHSQPRTEIMSVLAREVLRGRVDPVTVTAHQRITVVHGMGGSGKSALAGAFVRSAATRQAFDHGIIWINLDAEATSEQAMRRIGEHMTGLSPAWAARNSCVKELGKLLDGKRVPIVLDNAASMDPLEALDSVLDTETRVLGTTRRAGLAADLRAQSVLVDDLREDEALRLLADWSRMEPVELPP